MFLKIPWLLFIYRFKAFTKMYLSAVSPMVLYSQHRCMLRIFRLIKILANKRTQLSLFHQVQVETGVTVEIKFLKFRNPTGRNFYGSYCEVVSSWCETYFKLCVKLSSSVPTSFANCDYKPSTERYVRKNYIDFQLDNSNVAKKIIFEKDQWMGVCTSTLLA